MSHPETRNAMRITLRIVALTLALGAALWWVATGASQGWTKTSVERKVIDEITGIETPVYEKQFVPGVDFLGAALLGAGALAGASFLFRKSNATQPT